MTPNGLSTIIATPQKHTLTLYLISKNTKNNTVLHGFTKIDRIYATS